MLFQDCIIDGFVSKGCKLRVLLGLVAINCKASIFVSSLFPPSICWLICLLLIDFTSLGQINSSHSYCYLLLSPATTIPLSCLCWEDLCRFCQADTGGTELSTLTVTARFFSDYLPSYSLPKAGRTAEHSQSAVFFWRVPPKIRLFKAGSVYSYV